jgi:hypothetical protein
MNRIAMIVVAVLTCVAIVSASTVFVVYNPFQAQVSSSNKSSSVFDAELTYAFTGRTNATGEGHDHFGWGIETYPSDYYPVTAILNLTYRGNPENEDYDVICEGYMLNFTADTGAFVSVLGWLGTNYNISCKSPPMPPRDSPWGHFSRMYFRFNMSTGDKIFLRATDGGTFSSVNGTLGLWSNGTPNMITVTVQRAGWLTFRGNETSNVINPDVNTVIQQITLQKIGEDLGFGIYPSGRVY